MNAGQFRASLEGFVVRDVIGGAEFVLREGATAGYRQLNQSTPRDKGNAANSFLIGIGRKPTRTPGDITRGASQNPYVADGGHSALRRVRLGQTIYLTSYQSYIEVLNNGGFVPKNPGPSKDPRPGRRGRILVSGGYSVQAPQGMSLGATNVALAAIAQAAARARAGRRR